MGFERKTKVFNIKFAEDHEFYGLEMKMRAVNVDFYREFAQTAFKMQEFQDTVGSDDLAAQQKALTAVAALLDEMRVLFAEKLISWNMEEDGKPYPSTLEGVRLLEDSEFQAITTEWLQAVGSFTGSLGKGSGSGEISPELSLMMEPLSPSRAS